MASHILIVDDDQDLSFMVKQVLIKNNFEVTIARDGAEGLKALKTLTPDLIICDLTMPQMSGWHFTSKIRQDPRFTKTPIIVVSGLLQDNTQPEAYEVANVYMGKPFDVFKLLETVKELISASNQKR